MLTLTPPEATPIVEMSGVSYVGEFAGKHRFVAATETHQAILQFDLALQADGAIAAISDVMPIPLTPASDFEGIAYTGMTRGTVFLSDENGPGVREFGLGAGAFQAAVAVPSVFTANKRANLGFESLTLSPDGALLWTANEEALTVDGPRSTQASGTTVRLLQFDVVDDVATAGSQFAYQTEPIHATALGAARSGLVDLVAMPDGTLLALERSAAVGAPLFLSRVFEIDRTAATDVSQGVLAAGLMGQAFAPVAKTLLWSGAVDEANGQNWEGLALGPLLPGVGHVLIGVVDADTGDAFSTNGVAAFVVRPSADFSGDGIVDGADLLKWQQGQGRASGASNSDGDANRDGKVDDVDLEIWRANLPPAAAVHQTPEPHGALLALGASAAPHRRRRT